MRKPAVLISTCLILLAAPFAAASPEDEVRQTFERFVAVQNAHDIRAVGSLLLDSPNFLWITRGAPVWGHEAALKRFSTMYEGTWQLAPEADALKVLVLAESTAQIFVPLVFKIGAPGRAPQTTRFLMNQVLVKTSGGWKIASILPIAASVP
jgi:ketosteroid isomerase-like protein